MDLDVFKESLRLMYGIDVIDDKSEFILSKSIKKLSEGYPLIVTNYILSVANQRSYVVDEDDIITLKKVYYSRTPGGEHDLLGSELSQYDLSSSLSRQFTEIMERETFNRLHPVDASITNYNGFDLIPAPSESGLMIYYEFSKYREITDIPQLFEDDLAKLYLFYSREEAFYKTLNANNGNVFAFDRRGQVGVQAGADDPVKQREAEMKIIMSDIRKKVMMMG